MGLDATQLRELIVRPVIKALGFWSPAAENLVMGTGAQESAGFRYIHQLGNGPALGLFQVEPTTYYDYWSGYLAEHPDVANKVRRAVSTTEGVPPVERVVWDLRLAAMMCRIHYRRIRAPLPDADDVHALAAYYKKYYNSVYGKATEQEFVDNYRFTR